MGKRLDIGERFMGLVAWSLFEKRRVTEEKNGQITKSSLEGREFFLQEEEPELYTPNSEGLFWALPTEKVWIKPVLTAGEKPIVNMKVQPHHENANGDEVCPRDGNTGPG